VNDLAGLNPSIRPVARRFVEFLRMAGLKPVVRSVYRSTKDQTRLYQRWLAGLSRFPAAPPGRSSHEKRLAFDISVNDPRMLDQAGPIWERLGPGFVWGGRFKDPIHFEYRPR
jgi:hypothetical protein